MGGDHYFLGIEEPQGEFIESRVSADGYLYSMEGVTLSVPLRLTS